MSRFWLKSAFLSVILLSVWAISVDAQTPSLSSPANGATDQSTSLTLSWSSATNTLGYSVQVSTASDFSSGTSGLSDIAGLATPLGSFSNATSTNTTSVPYYYWRVSTSDAGSSWSNGWSFTTLPAVPSLALPTNGAINQPTSLTLSWSSATGASKYNVVVSTSSSFATMVFSQTGITTGLSASVNSGLVNSATYYWAVAATDANGNTLGWSAANSFTTVVAAPGVPVLSSPTDNAQNQAITGLTLSWASNASGGPVTSYAVQVGTSTGFSSTVLSMSGLTATSEALPTLLNSTKYYWEVTATGNGTAMKLDSFVTAAAVIAAPGAPVLSSPSDNAQNQAVAGLTLSWTSGSGGPVTSYTVQVSTSSTFSSTVYKVSDLTTTSQTLPTLVSGTTYYWEVTATGPGGLASEIGNFTTMPGTPTLTSPGSNARNQSISPTLSWTTVPGEVTYNVQVSTSSGFGITVLSKTGITGTSLTVSPALLNNTTYYWEVKATNLGSTSNWSSVGSFTTVPATPGAPMLTLPTTGASNQPISGLTLSWAANTSGGLVTSYNIQVSTSSGFGTTVFNESDITAGSSQVVSGLTYATTYYWKVNASNPGGTSDWSSVWSFTTIPLAPGAPLLTSPTDNAQDQPISGLTLSWAANFIGGEVTSFDVRVSTSAGFGTTDFSQSGTGLTATVSGLKNDMLYYWIVSATNAAGTSWSSVWSFTTVPPPVPGVPTLSSPTNGAINVAIPVSLSWASTAGGSVASYAVQVSTSSGFGTTVFSRSGITSGSSQVVNDLTTGALYYWEVNATNAGGTSGWAGPRSFTTVPATPGAPGLPVNPSPPDNAINLPISGLTLSWASSGSVPVTSYNVQVSTDAGFGTTVFSKSGITGLSQMVASSLTNGTKYYWEVSAINSSGTNGWAGPWNFTTVPATPEVPSTLVSSWIATNPTGMTVPVTLSWNAATGAATYNVQVSTDAGFGTTVFSQSGITGLAQVVNLANNMSYYWEVSATNAGGTSAWTSASFTITFTSVLKVAPEAARTDFAVRGEALVYSLNVAGPVGITFSDLLGRTALMMNRTLPAGHYTMALKDFSLAAGRYVVQFKAAGIQKRQIILIQR
jgi:hypothetical protein